MSDSNINIPPELAQQLQARAKSMGMDLATYLRFLENRSQRGHSPGLERAMKQLYRRYPATLRKLAQ